MKVVVIVEGGIVQHIIVDNENIDVVVVDYDTDGMEESEIVTTHNGDKAYVYSGLYKEVDIDLTNKYFEL